MLSERKTKQFAEARKYIQHKPLSEETRQKTSKANNGNFMRFAIIVVRNFIQKNLLLLKENIIFVAENAIQNIALK